MRIFCFALYMIMCCLMSTAIKAQVYTDSVDPKIRSVLDTSDLRKWETLGFLKGISPDGNYVYHTIQNRPVGSQSITVKGTASNWKIQFSGNFEAKFSNDSKFIFLKENDILHFVKLGKGQVEVIPDVISYSVEQLGHEAVLMYLSTNDNGCLTVKNPVSKQQYSFKNVKEYHYNSRFDMLWLKLDSGNGSLSLSYAQLKKQSVHSIWVGQEISNLIFNDKNGQIGFLGKNAESSFNPGLWLYKPGEKAAAFTFDKKRLDGPEGMTLGSLLNISDDGNLLFFTTKPIPKNNKPAENGIVDVYNYKDLALQSEQLKRLNSISPFVLSEYASVLNLKQNKIINLESPECRIINRSQKNAVLQYKNTEVGDYEFGLNVSSKQKFFVQQFGDGRRSELTGLENAITFCSPGGSYILYYDTMLNSLFSYSLIDGKRIKLLDGYKDSGEYKELHYGQSLDRCRIEGWLRSDQGAILTFQNDLWRIDLTGREKAMCITNGYGLKNNLNFQIVNGSEYFENPSNLTLLAYNSTNKENGFYRQAVKRGENPELLSMGPYIYYIPFEDLGDTPVKAKNTDAYIVQRMSEAESPNLFFTKDFKNFVQLSDVNPEKGFNWLKTTLIGYNTLDGVHTQGILYTPQQLDSLKKYPVIIHYYEKLSYKLHEFQQPGFSNGEFNIPWFVSRGYFVFTPDIHYNKIGGAGESALNSVVAATKILAGHPMIDAKKIGLQGHSFGGFETNYIVSHTNMFAAACSAAGVSNAISGSSGVHFSGASAQGIYIDVNGQMRLGKALWEAPEVYIANSPIFKVKQIMTPLLLMANINDDRVLFEQGFQLFVALRSLKKPVWMLQYSDGRHNVEGNSAKDFTARMTQFFDHYLKGKPAPIWMTRGINADKKGIDDGLKLDAF